MIAMFFLAFIVTQLAALSAPPAANTSLSKRTTLANQLADEAIEKSRNTPYENLQLAIAALGETCAAPASSSLHLHRQRQPLHPRAHDHAAQLLAGASALASSNQTDIDVTVSFTDARGTTQAIQVASVVSRH